MVKTAHYLLATKQFSSRGCQANEVIMSLPSISTSCSTVTAGSEKERNCCKDRHSKLGQIFNRKDPMKTIRHGLQNVFVISGNQRIIFVFCFSMNYSKLEKCK